MILKPHYEIKTADKRARGARSISCPSSGPTWSSSTSRLPEIDGLEVLRRIQADRSHHRDRDDHGLRVAGRTVKLALSHGAFEYLIKPFLAAGP